MLLSDLQNPVEKDNMFLKMVGEYVAWLNSVEPRSYCTVYIVWSWFYIVNKKSLIWAYKLNPLPNDKL